MDGILEKVLFVFAVIIAGAIAIGWFMGMFNDSMDSGNKAAQDINRMNVYLDESEFTQYDSEEIYGSSVVNIIKKYEQEKAEICIVVNNGRTETEYVMNSSLTQEASHKIKEAKNKSDLNLFINPTTLFMGEVIRDTDTDAIVGLKFTKVQ